MRRGYSATVDGPIAIDLGLFAQDGWIKVEVRPDCTRALIGLTTEADQGPSADAVRDATVEAAPDGRLIATVHGIGAPSDAAVEITVVAPTGSTLIARTDSAHIGAIGLADAELRSKSGNISVPDGARLFAESASGSVTIQRATDVTATSHSGAVSVGAAHGVTARTTSGEILLGAVSGEVTAKSVSGRLTVRDLQGPSLRADNTSGSITVHASVDSTIRARTVSGDITVTATPTTNLNLQTSTTTGRIAKRTS